MIRVVIDIKELDKHGGRPRAEILAVTGERD
jgi:hypothetical protein